MTDSSADRNPVDRLAEEFAERCRHGERPSLTEYTAKYPDLADEIRLVFPALAVLERFKPAVDEATGDFGGGTRQVGPCPERLGDYRLIREVGRGGMGVVYEAEQESLGRRVALKVLPGHALLDGRQRLRFRREARAAAQLHHTNIVPVYGVGEADGLHYYAMQFIQGQPLDQVLEELRRLRQAEGGPAASPTPGTGITPPKGSPEVSAVAVAQSLLTGEYNPAGAPGRADVLAPDARPPAAAALPAGDAASARPSDPSAPSALSASGRGYWRGVARIGVEVAEALHHAAGQGVLHRDIKPSNLLLDGQGNVWVTDFGLAKVATDRDNLTHTGDIVGTLRYMAPERFNGLGDVRGDVYSLGLTLYELLTLRPAFDETDRSRLLAQVMHGEPPRPRQVNPEVPRDLETVVLKAIAREPARRYQTAAELAEDLRCFAEDRPIRARQAGALERLWRWSRRNPVAAALIGVSGVAMLALVGAVVALLFNVQLQAAKEKAEEAQQQAEEAQQRAEQYQYFHHIDRVHAGWREGNLSQVATLLETAPADRRGWEWYYLQRLCHAELLTLPGFTGWEAASVAYSSDGTRILSGPKIWDATTGRLIRTVDLEATTNAAPSPDGKRWAETSSDGKVRVWDAESGQELLTFQGIEWAKLFFSSDGKRLLTCTWAGALQVWDSTTGQKLFEVKDHPVGINRAVFSPDGKHLITACADGKVRFWDPLTGRPGRELKAHGWEVWDAEFSPDGARLATASYDRTVKVWDVATGREIHTLKGHTNFVVAVTFSPDGARLASASLDGAIKLWNAAGGTELLTLKGHTRTIVGLVFSPDGAHLASACLDETVKVWDTTIDPEARVFQRHTEYVSSVTFSPDDTRFATTGMDGLVKVCDVRTGQELLTLRGHAGGLKGVAFSPDGKRLASGGYGDHTVRVWDALNGQPVRVLKGHTGPVTGVKYSPDGTRLASSSFDGTVKIWDPATGVLVQPLTGHTGGVKCLAFSPDGGKLASGSADVTVKVWDVATGQAYLTLKGHYILVASVVFSPDGTRLASAAFDRTVKVWDAGTGSLIHTLQGHTWFVDSVDFSPDGRRLVSAGMDGAVKLWDVESGQEILTLWGEAASCFDARFSHDGARLVLTGKGGAKFWDARPLGPDAVVEREALGLLEFLFAKPLCKADVIDHLRNSPTISEPARQLALEVVDRYHEETDPERYHRAAWAVARQRYLNANQYRFALRQAKAACRLAPDRPGYRTALGMALYRNGRYQEALGPLETSLKAGMGQTDVLNQTFLALCHARLGDAAKARDCFDRAVQSADSQKKLSPPQAEELRQFRVEAEELLNSR
jgi:WD40 repeat protein/serine/threonine protein kinase